MGLGSKVRFEIFKRDGFTCQYCGRKTPAVILEVDHVVPVASGGSDDTDNLVTSCFDCNRGKGATGLKSVMPAAGDPHEKAAELAEREIQIREYNEIRRKRREREDAEINWIHSEWERLCPRAFEPPSPVTLRRHLQALSVYDIGEAVESVAMAMDRRGEKRVHYSGALPYFYAILRNMADPDAE